MPVGRPSMLTPKRHKRIVEAIRNGSYKHVAARANDISEATLFSWVRKGKAEKKRREQDKRPDRRQTKYLNFLNDITRAEAEAEHALAERWMQIAAEGSKRTSTTYELEYDSKGNEKSRKPVKVIEEKMEDWRPGMEMLARRYGWTKPEDAEAVMAAVISVLRTIVPDEEMRKMKLKDLKKVVAEGKYLE